MTSDKHKLTLMSLPLEVRHCIFEFVAARDTKPKKLLRYWFEKQEVKEKTAELAARNPNGSAPQVVYAGDQSTDWEDDSAIEDGEEEEDSDEEGDSDEDADGVSDDEDEVEDEDEGSSEEEDAETDETDDTALPSTTTTAAAAQVPTAPAAPTPPSAAQQVNAVAAQSTATISAGAGQAVTAANQGLLAALAAANAAIQYATATVASLHPPTSAAPLPTSASVQVQGQGENGAGNSDVEMIEDSEEDHNGTGDEGQDDEMDEDGENDAISDAGADSDEEMAEEDDDGEVQPAPPAPIISVHSKWRHIPKFMRITHCPPPTELFLSSKQLNAEAKSWFYDVAVLHVDATGSFAHTSFFEEAFSQITEAAFSPIENIRKADITFVWDTAWLRSDYADYAGAIFPALLRQRALFVTGILAQAPNLEVVNIHWHDSAEDEEAVNFMNDVLMGFLSLEASVKVEPHYIADDAKPYRKSIAGKQRLEFQRIVETGLDRLF